MEESKKSKFLVVALRAVKEAERVVMKYYGDLVSVSLKSDRTPSTIADEKAEQVIIKTIKREFPEHGFLGEEFGETNLSKSEYVWIIDPIDGTKRYIRGMPLFGTQIALMQDRELVLGVSNMPAMKELLYAEKECGAYYNNLRISVSDIRQLDRAYISFGSLISFENHNLISNLLELERSIQFSRGIGDVWSYHLLALGKIDAVVEVGVKIWDVAAMKVIIEEAGGKVSDLGGNPIGRDTTSIIATNNWLHDSILGFFARS